MYGSWNTLKYYVTCVHNFTAKARTSDPAADVLTPHNVRAAIQVLRDAIFLEIGPPPTFRNAFFSRKSDTPTPICVK